MWCQLTALWKLFWKYFAVLSVACRNLMKLELCPRLTSMQLCRLCKNLQMHPQLWWISNTTHDRAFSLHSYRLNIIICKIHSNSVKGSLHKKLSRLKLNQLRLKQSRSTTLVLAIPIQPSLLDRNLALVHYTYRRGSPNTIPKYHSTT